MKIVNDKMIFDEEEIRLHNVCLIHPKFGRLIFALRDGSFIPIMCEDIESAIDKFIDISNQLEYNPNFFKVDGINAIVNICGVQNVTREFENETKKHGLMINYGNQEIGVYSKDSDAIDKCYTVLQEKIKIENQLEKEQ